jgi:hypothetical protein
LVWQPSLDIQLRLAQGKFRTAQSHFRVLSWRGEEISAKFSRFVVFVKQGGVFVGRAAAEGWVSSFQSRAASGRAARGEGEAHFSPAA